MIAWVTDFGQVLFYTCLDVLPIAAVIIGFQVLVLRRPLAHFKRIIVGFLYVLLGIAFFLNGLETALFPLGKLMAKQLASADLLLATADSGPITWQAYGWVYLFAASLGFASALAEPSLLAVALKAEQISGGSLRAWGLRVTVASGVAVGLALGTFRIVTGGSLHFYIASAYAVVLLQTLFAPRAIIALAYDSGGVTTSTVTVPLVTALGLGLAAVVPGRSPLLDGFGLIAFACLFPIIALLGYAQFVHWLNRLKSKT